jgi:hypothetical protein
VTLRRHAYRLAALLVLVLALAVGSPPDAGWAQRPPIAPGRPVRLEGYWDRTRRDPGIIGEIVVGSSGADKRGFGVSAAQAFNPEEEGAQIFRGSSLQPVTLLLRGPLESVRRFLDAAPGDKIVAFGLYYAGPAQLVLSSVELEPAPHPTSTPD